MTQPISKELWFSFRFYVFPSCPACWMEHMTLAKPNMHSNALAAYKDWLIDGHASWASPVNVTFRNFAENTGTKLSFLMDMREGVCSTGNCWQASWDHKSGGAMAGRVELQTKQNWAVVTSLSSWISPCQTPERLFSTFMFSHHCIFFIIKTLWVVFLCLQPNEPSLI